jgi:hypothetical protein
MDEDECMEILYHRFGKEVCPIALHIMLLFVPLLQAGSWTCPSVERFCLSDCTCTVMYSRRMTSDELTTSHTGSGYDEAFRPALQEKFK